MGLDDLVDDTKESKEKEEVNTLSEELGVDDLEDLEKVDGRLQDLFQIMISQDRRIEELEDDIRVLKSLVKTHIKQDVEGDL